MHCLQDFFRRAGKGQNIELTIKGFASPLAKTDYNVKLTGRRITSLINYLREYDKGQFNEYIDATAENGGTLSFNKIPFGEYTASKLVSDNVNDTKNSVYSRAGTGAENRGSEHYKPAVILSFQRFPALRSV